MKGLVLKVTVLAISLFSRIASAREPFDKKELSKNLMTLRTDFNKIVEDAENFSMDFFKQVAAASAGTFDNDVDYRWDSADSSNTIHKQNNQVPLTSSTVKETTWEDTITPPTSPVAIQSFPPLLNRKKRMAVSREPAQSEPCAAQNQREYELEKRRLFELKTEVQRLNEVVALLRDQQELLQALERKSNDVNADPKTKREIQTLLQLLGVDGSKKNETQRKEPTEARIEIETIKNDLKRTAEALNRTHEMLVQEQRKEETIEEELDSQKRELGFLKVMLMSLYEKSGNRNTSADPVVGAVHRPKSLPPKMASTRQAERGDHLERASGDDVDVDKLLNLLEQSKKKKTDEDDLKSKILELEAEVKKKKEREELAKAIRKMTAKSDPSTKLAQALIALNQPQSKADDDDVEAELQSLQAAINRLRPDDDSALAPVRGKNEAQDFQAMLTKLLTQNGVPQQAGIAISGAQKPQFSPEQWFQLSQMMSKSGYGPGFSAESVYGKPLGPYRDYDYGGYDVAPPPFPRGYGAGADRQYLALLSGSYNRVNPYSLPPYDSQSSGYGAYPAYDSSRFKTPYGSNYYNPPQYKGPFVGPPPPYATENSYGNINGGPKPAYFKPQTSDVQKPFFYPGSNYAAASSLATKPASYGDVAAANYNPQFFPPMPDKAPDYPGGQQSADYGPKGYTGSGLDQSSYTVQKANDNYAVIADLKQQIGNLENVIKGLSRADYSQKPEDKETIANLEQKIYELKNVISAINQPSYDGGQNGGGYDQKASADGAGGPAYVSPPKARRRREAPDERQEPRTRIAEPDPLSQVAAFFQNYLKENSTPPGAERSGNVAELQAKLDALKTQLEARSAIPRSVSSYYNNNAIYPFPIPTPANVYGNVNSYSAVPAASDSSLKKTAKHQDIFTQILLSILDKVLASLPDVVGHLLGNSITEITNSYGDSYSPIQKILGNLGSLGTIPLVLVKILESVNHIFQTLRKNQFFRRFLLPGVVFLLVGGAILFLFWFFDDSAPYTNRLEYGGAIYPTSYGKRDDFLDRYRSYATGYAQAPRNNYYDYPDVTHDHLSF